MYTVIYRDMPNECPMIVEISGYACNPTKMELHWHHWWPTLVTLVPQLSNSLKVTPDPPVYHKLRPIKRNIIRNLYNASEYIYI